MVHEGARASPVSGMHQAIQGAVQEAVQEHLEVWRTACMAALHAQARQWPGWVHALACKVVPASPSPVCDVWVDAQGVHEAVQDAVTEAVQAAVDEGMNFDVRANLYTLIAITGVSGWVPRLLCVRDAAPAPCMLRHALLHLQGLCCTGEASGRLGESAAGGMHARLVKSPSAACQ